MSKQASPYGRQAIHSPIHVLLARFVCANLCAFVVLSIAPEALSAWRANSVVLAAWLVLAASSLFIARQCVRGAPSLFVSQWGIHIGEGAAERVLRWSTIRAASRLSRRRRTAYWADLFRVELSDGRKLDFSGVSNTLELLDAYRPCADHAERGRDRPLSP